MQMIYLTNDEVKERLVKSRRHTNQLPNDTSKSPAERSAELLYQQLMFFLGTDRQDYYVQSVLRYLQMTIKEKIYEQDYKNLYGQ
jgi:hypothetical protein